MPKNQNLSIAQNRINGVCGQIKCCMKYEDEVYSHKRKRLPKDGSYVKLLNGDIGKVLKTHIIKEEFDLLTDRGVIKRYNCHIYNPGDHAPPQSWNFPKEFNLITNETNDIVQWAPKAKQESADKPNDESPSNKNVNDDYKKNRSRNHNNKKRNPKKVKST